MLFGCGLILAAVAGAANQASAAKVEVQNDNFKAEAENVVTLAVDPGVELRPIKPMNAVNNGPNFALDPNKRKEQRTGWFVHYRNGRFPMARIHDARNTGSPPNHAADINCIFTDWNADENDPKSYDFTITDWILHSTRLAGTEIMFRLGNSADQGPKQYGSADVPKDFGKWARVAEHVIRHYNEGWGWTTKPIPFKNQFKVKYWEIWNEADLGCPASYWSNRTNYWRAKPRYWNGRPESFFKFYATVAKHLKSTFPDLKIGGPSVAGVPHWTDHFLGYCATNAVPIDFFSWHIYADRVEKVPAKAAFMKKLLVKHGYGNAESVLNEWDWITGWYGDEFRSSTRIRTGPDNFKMAAFYAGVMSAMQDSSADMLMYYDARMPTHYNGIFDYYSQRPTKGYYALYAWAKMRDLGTQVKAVLGRKDAGLWVTAAKGTDGAMGIYLARYTLDANVVKNETVRIAVAGRSMAGARCHLTDDLNRYTEAPLAVLPDGSAEIDMDPNAFAFIELPKQ